MPVVSIEMFNAFYRGADSISLPASIDLSNVRIVRFKQVPAGLTKKSCEETLRDANNRKVVIPEGALSMLVFNNSFVLTPMSFEEAKAAITADHGYRGAITEAPPLNHNGLVEMFKTMTQAKGPPGMD